MGASWTALLIAVVGVAGTLGAALVTQVRADRTKRMELLAAAEQRREERGHAEQLIRAEQTRQGQRESLEQPAHLLHRAEHRCSAVRDGDDQPPPRGAKGRGHHLVPGEPGDGPPDL